MFVDYGARMTALRHQDPLMIANNDIPDMALLAEALTSTLESTNIKHGCVGLLWKVSLAFNCPPNPTISKS